MKNGYFIAVILIVLQACSSPKNLYQRGDLNGAIALGVEKQRKGKLSNKQKIYFEKAYNEITQIELSRIELLKKEGNPANAEGILELYQKIHIRQQLVKTILPLYIGSEYRNADIHIINIEDELIDAKNRTADYLYNISEKLLRAGTKSKAREAYNNYKKLLSLFNDYKDVKWKIDTALSKSITNVMLDFKYVGNQIIPVGMFDNMYQWDIQSMDIGWLRFTTNNRIPVDKVLLIQLNQTQVGPEQLSERSFTETRRIHDGYTVVYDSAGKVKRDLNGKEVKVKKFRDVYAVIRHVIQHKEGSVNGTYNIIQYKNNESLFSIPFNQAMVFHNEAASFIGDSRALSDATNALLGRRLLPPPTNESMIADGLQLIKNDVRKVIEANLKKLESE